MTNIPAKSRHFLYDEIKWTDHRVPTTFPSPKILTFSWLFLTCFANFHDFSEGEIFAFFESLLSNRSISMRKIFRQKFSSKIVRGDPYLFQKKIFQEKIVENDKGDPLPFSKSFGFFSQIPKTSSKMVGGTWPFQQKNSKGGRNGNCRPNVFDHPAPPEAKNFRCFYAMHNFCFQNII